MELVIVLLIGAFAGSAVTYDTVVGDTERARLHLTICRMELSEANAEVRECKR
jgi:hypothetical protein